MADNRPLNGIRVFELGVALAAPLGARYMAEFGAEVIRVETPLIPDLTRTVGPGWLSREKYGMRVWLDCANMANELNTGKLSVALNLKTPEAMEAAKRLLKKCDLFLSNFSPDAVASLGLDQESVRAIKPDIIYALVNGYGASPDTPYYKYLALGPNLTSLSGLDELTSFPDGRLMGMASFAYSDFATAILGLIAMLAALNHRTRTGKTQAIDVSHYEATVGFLGPQLMDYLNKGRPTPRAGNRITWAAPQGVYRCRGFDRWVAISVLNDEEWRSLCTVAEHPEWTTDPRFATNDARLANHDELDALIESWTMEHAPSEIEAWLQWAGVAAFTAVNHAQLVVDQHLQSRDFWLLPNHARWGKDLTTGNPIRLSETPGHAERALPSMGQDNQYVLGELCGYSDAEIEAMIAKGAVFPMDRPEVKLQRRYVPWIRHFMPQLPWPDPKPSES